MSAYIGPLGGLLKLHCPSGLEEPTGGIGYATQDTTTGRRDAQMIASRRAWNLGTATTAPENLNTLEVLRFGGLGRGPFVWVSPAMIGTNLVSPWDNVRGQSTHPIIAPAPANWAKSATRVMPDGAVVPAALSQVSVPASPTIFTTSPIPVDPSGGPVTVSAYLQGAGAQVIGAWVNATGAVLASSPGSAIGSGIERSYLTATPPAGAVGVHVAATTVATFFAGACVTWTPQLFPFVVGRGCYAAVLDQASYATTLAVLSSPTRGRLDSGKYVVTEVG